MRFLIRVVAILLSIWTILAALTWYLIYPLDRALGNPQSLADTLTVFAIPAVGWILVIVAWVTTEHPWRNRHISDYEEDGVWVGNIYLPNRASKD